MRTQSTLCCRNGCPRMQGVSASGSAADFVYERALTCWIFTLEALCPRFESFNLRSDTVEVSVPLSSSPASPEMHIFESHFRDSQICPYFDVGGLCSGNDTSKLSVNNLFFVLSALS